MFSDELIMHLMPDWVIEPRLASVFSGLILLSGGLFIVLGFELKKVVVLLGGAYHREPACPCSRTSVSS